MVTDAMEICEAYNVEMLLILREFGVETEGEALSGYVLKFGDDIGRKHGTHDRYQIQWRLNRKINDLRATYRSHFLDGIDEDEGSVKVAKAAAWHVACQRTAQLERKEGRLEFVSFPWVVSDVLLRIIKHELQMQR